MLILILFTSKHFLEQSSKRRIHVVNGDIKRLQKTNDSQDHDTIQIHFLQSSIFLAQSHHCDLLLCPLKQNTNFSFWAKFQRWQHGKKCSKTSREMPWPPSAGPVRLIKPVLLRERVVTSPFLNRLLVDSNFKVGRNENPWVMTLMRLMMLHWKSVMFCFYLCGPADSLHGFIIADARMTFIIRRNWQQRGNQETHNIRFDMFFEANSQHHQP